MSITDELREYAGSFYLFRYKDVREKLDAIADRIDQEADEEAARKYLAGFDEGFASADDWMNMNEDDLSKHGWFKLPVDADGKPVHVGDVMEWDDGQTAEVVGVSSDTFFYVDYANDSADWAPARDKCHHHALTVEDVLRGVVTLCHNTWKEGSAFEFYDVDDVMESGNIADFAAKLQLREDA